MTRTLRGVPAIAAFLLLTALAGGRGDAAAPAGSNLVNQATASYESLSGAKFGAASNVITVAIAAVSSLTLGPQDPACASDADTVAVNGSFSRSFVVGNTSNGPDAYQITNASVSAGRVTSIAFVSANGSSTPATIGATSSVVSPGGTLGILVTVNDTGVSAGTKVVVTLSVRTTYAASNGASTASAARCGLITSPPVLSGASGGASAIAKTVNGVGYVAAASGATVNYDIVFKNTGGSVALGATLDDPVPAGISPILGTVDINGTSASGAATFSGSTLRVALGNVAIGELVDVSFSATVSSSAALGTSMVNTATIAATNASTATTQSATVFLGTSNVVYDGDTGATAPIAGAIVTLTDSSGTTRTTLSGAPAAPNTANVDPYTTGSAGQYGFGVAAPKTATTYTLTVTASGYAPRHLRVVLVPNAAGTLYTVTLTALDGAPLAIAGGYALVTGPVTLAQVYGSFGNIPMFPTQSLAVSKVVDRATAAGGDRLVYTLTVANTGPALGATTVEDDLPQKVAYAPHTARVDGVSVEPAIDGSRLRWTFPALAKQHEIVFAAVVVPNANEGDTLNNQMVARAGLLGSPGFFATARAQAQTIVAGGLFSERIPITGRVFYDVAKTGRFVKGDVGVPAVRVWLEDGESVLTDPNGRFDFPATRPGMHVLHLDRDTLPPGAALYDTQAYNDQRSAVRLVHGVFDGGMLQDVNFAIVPPAEHP